MTGQRSAVASAAPGEAASLQRFRDLGKAAMCVTRAHAAPRAGAEKCARPAAASRVAAVVAAGASRVVVAAAAVAAAAVVVAAVVAAGAGGEAGVGRVAHQP